MKKSSAQAHANHAHYCTCGRVVHGNGGKYHHREMHRRRKDGHHPITREQWMALPSNAGVSAAEIARGTHG